MGDPNCLFVVKQITLNFDHLNKEGVVCTKIHSILLRVVLNPHTADVFLP